MNKPRKRPVRTQVGALGALIFCAIFLITIALGAIALDIAHVSTVRTELQSATDAAALAGAQSLVKDPDNAEAHALEIASSNTADGKAVDNTVDNRQVTCLVDTISDPPTVTVDATAQVKHMLAPIFGRSTDSISVSSKSAMYAPLTILAANQAFPISVSIDQWPQGPGGTEKPLNQLHLGDTATIVVRPSGNPGRNAAWTSFKLGSANTSIYVSLIRQVLGLDPPDPSHSIPQLEAGVDSINIDNGQNVGTGVDTTYSIPIKSRPFIVFPIISGSDFSGSKLVRGFATMQVETISGTSGTTTFRGKLVKGLVRGFPGTTTSTGNAANDAALAELGPTAVKLLSTSGQ
jgi:Flp pilus assembly protein TadG